MMKRIFQCMYFLALTLPASSQSWITLTPPPVSQTYPVVVALRGNIHAIGGSIAGTPTNLHLRYSPVTDSWDTMPPMPYSGAHPAGGVINERIHICGGEGSTWLDNHYYFDPDSVQWYQAADLPAGIAIHETAVIDDRMYVLSGMPSPLLFQYYDSVTDSWTVMNPLLQDCNHSAVDAVAGEIYTFGGGIFNFPSANAEKYDPVNDVWITLPPLPMARCSPAMTMLDSSRILISGGYANIATSECWIYHIPSQSYFQSDDLAYPTSFHNMVTIDSCVYSLGAYNGVQPATNVWLTMNCNPIMYTSISPESQVFSVPYSITMTSTECIIRPESPGASSLWSMFVYDSAGRKIKNNLTGSTNGEYHIDGTDLKVGLYTITIHTGSSVYSEHWPVIR